MNVPPGALSRAARAGNGWFSVHHDLDSIREPLARLRAAWEACGRAFSDLEISTGAIVQSQDELQAWAELGVHRITVSPWQRPREAIAGLEDFAANVLAR